jgi:transcriptional regulator with XRE-family HTH domain
MLTFDVREARERFEIKQIDLAREAPIDQSRLSLAEHGNTLLTSEELRRLESAFTRLITKRFKNLDPVLKGGVRLRCRNSKPGGKTFGPIGPKNKLGRSSQG